jgi:hypothetical protein
MLCYNMHKSLLRITLSESMIPSKVMFPLFSLFWVLYFFEYIKICVDADMEV